MPIYEYRCTVCGNVSDALQRMSDPVLTDCEPCGEGGLGALKKLFSAHVVGTHTGSVTHRTLPPGCGNCDNPQGPCMLPN